MVSKYCKKLTDINASFLGVTNAMEAFKVSIFSVNSLDSSNLGLMVDVTSISEMWKTSLMILE